MVIVVVIVVVLVVVTGAAWLVRRSGGDDDHSVEGYRHTLDTLGGIRSRSSSGTVRVLGQTDDPAAPADPGPGQATGPSTGPSTGPATGGGFPRPGTGQGRGLVFEDPATRPPASVGPTPSGGGRRPDRAISAMNRRPRRLGAPILVAAVVLAVLVAIILVGAHAHHPKSSTTTTTGPRSHPTTTVRGGAAGAHATTTTRPPPTTTTTSTTVPSSFTATTYTSTTGTYVPPAASYTVVLTAANGDCWLTVQSAGGTTVFTQTLTPGQSKSLPLTGVNTIEIGAPSALTVTIDRKPVVLPAGYQTPFRMTLQPAPTTSASTVAGATTTTTTTAGAHT